MLSVPLNLQHLPLTLQTILTNFKGVRLDLSEQLFDLSPQETQNVLEYIFTHFTHLRTLNLTGNKLEMLPDSISHLTQLTHLHLSHNKFSSLPDSISNLIQLTYLDLSYNRLTALTETLGHLIQLTQLYLSHNELTRLPETLGHLTQLTDLYLDSNKLTHLTQALSHLIQLTHLDLHDNQLTHLPDSISHLTRLTFLHLEDNKLTRLPLSIIKLSNHIQCHIKREQLTFLPAEWKTGYTGDFKHLKEFLCILSLDVIKQVRNFFFYSSLSKECYHLIKGKPLVSEESPPNVTAESSTKRIKYPQEASSQAPAPNSLSTSQPLPESPPEFHYFSQLPHDLSKKILLHAATIPTSHHPQFMKGLRKHLSDKLSFNSIQCFLEEAVPNWREKVRQCSEEIQKTSIPYR